MKDSQRRAMFARLKPRFYRGSDGWGRGSYSIPARAVLGSSYTGEYSDSPVRAESFKTEFAKARQVFKKQGIATQVLKPTRTGNVFCVKVWLGVKKPEDYQKARSIARSILKDKRYSYIHDAEGDAK